MTTLEPATRPSPARDWERLGSTKLLGLPIKDWSLYALLIAVPGLPVLFTLLAALRPSTSFDHIARVLLGEMALTSLALLVLATLGATILGVIAAWFVTAYQFWGRTVLSWALALPLAMPA